MAPSRCGAPGSFAVSASLVRPSLAAMSQVLAVVSAVLFGFADFVGGLASRRTAPWTVAGWTQVCGLPVLFLGLLIVDATAVEASDLVWGAAGGVIGLIGLAIMYSALAAGKMSVIAPIIGAGAAAIPVAYAVAVGERIEPIHWAGIAFAVVGVWLLSAEPGADRVSLRLFGQAIAAAVAFSVFFIAMGQTSEASGLWPLAAARFASVPIAAAVIVVSKTAALTPKGAWRLVAVSGMLDMGANVAIVLAVQRGPVGINAVLGSLYPVFTVAAAIFILREHPSSRQTAGIAAALVAIVLLAL